MASKPGGYSGGRDGPMGGRVGGASGTGHESNRGGGRKSDAPPHAGLGGGAVAGLGNPGGGFNPRSRPNNAPFAGMPSFQPRRTVNPSSSYELSPHNVAVVGNMLAPGGALRKGLGIGPTEFRGFTGNVNGPGDYDPKNAMRGQVPAMSMNRARAAALGGPAAMSGPAPAAPAGPMPWWRTPFPGVR